MKAGILTGVDQLHVEEVETPKINSSEILLKVKAAAICGTDIRILRGKKTKGVRYPSIIGHEFSGEVVDLGKDVSGFKVGDRVCVDPVLPCGTCYYCKNGMENICQNRVAIGYEYDGCFAEFVRIPKDFILKGNVQKLPNSASWISGALAEPLSCVINGQRKLDIKPGDTVVIIGAGPIGLMHTMLAKASGAKSIIVSEPTESRREVSREYGATILVDPIRQSLKESVYKETNGIGADIVIMAIGNPKIANEALTIGRKGARISFFAGFSKGDLPEMDVNLIHYNELVLVGASSLQRRDMETALKLIEAGSVDLEKMATHKFSLDEIIKAFDTAESGQAVKVVFEV
jgi:L-iditol 2-dehydrogenase